MAESLTNGNVQNGAESSMKMEIAGDTNMTDIQPAHDPTDPQPPPQPENLQPPVDRLSEMTAATPIQPATIRASSIPPPPPVRTQTVAYGGPTRQFLNQHITPHLLEGMKYLAMQEPDKPLLWLSEFLRDRSKEVEG
ncbi:hypothetical protein LTR35_012934 [Friedmanniomyces endolithicus]|uniref:COMPASS component SDC1 n=1 Tax=Friedmanniomyces endolithicus TaxID=329885 RepID=A0AAN6FN86_9PEZI|nr:hypothetical protein LTR35_012934 [Friedmanniomyces endolithicus]KAK0285493.1 hypothetical protein LTS00_010854 [Friedmanniomyces endolithicus]KAK0319165.1 hypothetical protein LTR82_009929 [Friedmanniomyces endolithicus]KAK0986962.1 hypothetical protein LTR54_013346 [Friedmanniomyces endolithicus]